MQGSHKTPWRGDTAPCPYKRYQKFKVFTMAKAVRLKMSCRKTARAVSMLLSGDTRAAMGIAASGCDAAFMYALSKSCAANAGFAQLWIDCCRNGTAMLNIAMAVKDRVSTLPRCCTATRSQTETAFVAAVWVMRCSSRTCDSPKWRPQGCSTQQKNMRRLSHATSHRR